MERYGEVDIQLWEPQRAYSQRNHGRRFQEAPPPGPTGWGHLVVLQSFMMQTVVPTVIFMTHVLSLCVSSQAHQEEVQEEELITVDAVGCFEGEEEEHDEEEVEVADEEETGGVGTEDNMSEVLTK